MDATIVLVRHGESQLIVEGRFQGRADSPLTEVGRDQARLVAARIGTADTSPALPIPTGPPTEIAHSPLTRAADTAGAIADALTAAGRAAPLRPEPGLLEIGQGDWEGLHRDEIRSRYGPQLDGWRATPTEVWAPGGEPLQDVASRVRAALGRSLAGLAARPAGERSDPVAGYRGAARPSGPWTLLVAHDGVFKVVLLTLFELPLERFWMWSFDLCGLTVVALRDGRAVLRAHNLTDHLAPGGDAASLAERQAREASGAL